MKTEKISYSEAKKRLDDYCEKRKAAIRETYEVADPMYSQKFIELGSELATMEHAINTIFGF